MKQHSNTQRPAKTLTLQRETLRRLDACELTAAHGAGPTAGTCMCPVTTRFCPPQPTTR